MGGPEHCSGPPFFVPGVLVGQGECRKKILPEGNFGEDHVSSGPSGGISNRPVLP